MNSVGTACGGRKRDERLAEPVIWTAAGVYRILNPRRWADGGDWQCLSPGDVKALARA